MYLYFFLWGSRDVICELAHRKKQAFRMAVAVAKARLPAETPLIRELYREWAAASAANGRTALAARCHAAAGDNAAGYR